MIQYGQVTSQPLTFIRELETGTDIRITESGDTRITDDVYLNRVEGSMTATATFIPWFAEQYVKRNDVWFQIETYAKSSGTWQQPIRIYKKISGNWKRVY